MEERFIRKRKNSPFSNYQINYVDDKINFKREVKSPSNEDSGLITPLARHKQSGPQEARSSPFSFNQQKFKLALRNRKDNSSFRYEQSDHST